MFKKLIPILIILSLVLPSAIHTAQADVLDSTIGFTSCAAGGYLSGLISKGLDDLTSWVNQKLGGFLGSGGGIFGSAVPVTDERAQELIDKFKNTYTTKEGVEDIVARCAAREVLTAMGKNILNVARTGGRDGGPAWVRNWRNFQLESQYRGEGIFRGMLSSTNICEYFGSDLKDVFQANQQVNLTQIKTRSGLDSFALQAGCTLPSNFDFDAYKQDFSGNGGWEAWSRLLEPQNNFYGTLFLSLDEVNKQRVIEESAALNEVTPTGFTSVRGRNAADSCEVRNPRDGSCLIYKDILTPGGILSSAVVAGIETELQWVATSDELDELIATGIEVLINRLWDLSNPDEGNYIVPGKVNVSITPFPMPTPRTPGPGGGGAGFCSDQGGSADYTGALRSAMDSVIANNPSGIADLPNTTGNSRSFLDLVAQELQADGFNATTDVLNGNDNPNSGDLIAIWRGGDTTVERYDAIVGAGAGDTPIRNATTTGFTGDIPLGCTGSGGGGGEEEPPPAS